MEDKFSAREMAILRYVISKNYDNYLESTQNIIFTTLAENGSIDNVTATEHIDSFDEWKTGITYQRNSLRQYKNKLYKCLQTHTSSPDNAPSIATTVWALVGDPSAEWPFWSAPIGSIDAYAKGDKVTHSGKHWISLADNNVWEPGTTAAEQLWAEQI